jgi:hypothetical protein
MTKTARANPIPSGYIPCACRDCMEIAIGAPGALCHECETAGCDPEAECCAPGAYGGSDEPEPTAPATPAAPLFHGAIELVVTHDEGAPLPYAIWLDDDILGAGNTPEEARQEARAQLEAWALDEAK